VRYKNITRVFVSKHNRFCAPEHMNLPPNNETYGEKAYWDERYAKEDEFDWFADYHLFKHHVIENVSKVDRILHLGEYRDQTAGYA
jgi:hypothetical protein